MLRERRIKCDEVKPQCLRCQRSKRTCGGYPPGAPSSDSNSSPSSTGSEHFSSPEAGPKPSLRPVSLVPWSSSDQQKLSNLACTVLGSDPYHIHSPSNAAVFSYLLPQLSVTVPCVGSAAAAFGAAYELAYLNKGKSGKVALSSTHYVDALRLLQEELRDPSHGNVPVLLASMLLAATETVQHRQKDALHHVLGAFALFQIRDRQQDTPGDPASQARPPASRELDVLEDVFRSMDTLIATFVWGKQPYFKLKALPDRLLASTKVEDLIENQPPVLHTCLHFIGKASSEEYREYNQLPAELLQEQDGLIARLRQWLSNYDRCMKEDAISSKPRCTQAEERHLCLLRAQTLAILIMICNLKTPAQTRYDKYLAEFEAILQCAETVLGQKHTADAADRIVRDSPLPAFSTSPGIIQPLFFLARKCRHSKVRRRAISLLRISGIEGPFNGSMEAAVAIRIVEIEEGRPYEEDADVLLPDDIPDSVRIASVWRLADREPANRVMKSIKVCRRRYLETNLDVSSSNNDREIEWETWEEYFSFDVGKGAGGFQEEPKSHADQHWRSAASDVAWNVEYHSHEPQQDLSPEAEAHFLHEISSTSDEHNLPFPSIAGRTPLYYNHLIPVSGLPAPDEWEPAGAPITALQTWF